MDFRSTGQPPLSSAMRSPLLPSPPPTPPPPPKSFPTPHPQGILSSFFFKFADTILKKYSSTIATIFTAIMSWAMFSHPLTANFAIGVSIVFVSMHLFFTFGDAKGGKGAGKGSEAGGVGAGVLANGVGGGGEGGKVMLHSPSMEHFRVQVVSGPASGGPGGLEALVEEQGVIGGGGGGRAPLLPR